MLDIRKNEIYVGARVAYNRSGYMATGRIREIKTTEHSHRYFSNVDYRSHVFHITNDQNGAISKVKDSRSILVIYET